MKSLNLLFNSFDLYLFDNDSFKKIANNTSLKTSSFTLFLFSFEICLFSGVIAYFKYNKSFTEILFLIIIGSILFFIFTFYLFLIISGFYHLIYKLFKSNAKFKKMLQMIISINLVASILFLIINYFFFLIFLYPNLIFHKTLMYLFGFFDFGLLIWYLIVNVVYLGKIQRVNNLKSLCAFLIPIFILGIIKYYFFK